ncbi:MAG: RidA family protein [Gemmatimonadaceae bacterium]
MRRTSMNAVLVGLCLSSAACATMPASAALPQYTPVPAGANRPFSSYVKANGLIFLAGQLGTDSTGRLAPGGIQAETRQAMTNIKALLDRNGSSMDRVVKCTVFLADMAERQAMSDVYVTFFPADKRPARTAAGANGLALNGRVEIECVAAM